MAAWQATGKENWAQSGIKNRGSLECAFHYSIRKRTLKIWLGDLRSFVRLVHDGSVLIRRISLELELHLDLEIWARRVN